MISRRDRVGTDAAVGRRQVDGKPRGRYDALVVIRALSYVPFDERRGGRCVGYAATGVGGRVATVRRGRLPAVSAAELRAVRDPGAGFGGRGRAAEVLAVRVRVGEGRATRGSGDVIAATGRQHRRSGILLLLVFVRVGRRRTAVPVVLATGHGREYVRVVHWF